MCENRLNLQTSGYQVIYLFPLFTLRALDIFPPQQIPPSPKPSHVLHKYKNTINGSPIFMQVQQNWL